MKNIAAAHFKIKNKLINKETSLFDEMILNNLQNNITLAESNIISTIKFQFNAASPNKYLYDLWEKHFKQDVQLLNTSKVVLLEFYRCGASLIYSVDRIVIASLFFSNILLKSIVIRIDD